MRLDYLGPKFCLVTNQITKTGEASRGMGILTLVVAILVTAMSATGCSGVKISGVERNKRQSGSKSDVVKTSGSGDTNSASNGQDTNGSLPLREGLGLRNFAAINATMAALTGIPSSTTAVLTEFNKLKTALPADADPQFFTAANQVAVFKLATQYCDSLVNTQDKLVAVIGSATTTNDGFFAEPNKRVIATALIQRFWGQNLQGRPDVDPNIGVISRLIDELHVTVSSTKPILTAACTAVLSAAPVILY